MVGKICHFVSKIIIFTYFSCSFVHAIDLKGFDDTTLFKLNWPGRDGNDLLLVSITNKIIIGSPLLKIVL